MAIFYPAKPLYNNNSFGEKQIFEALHLLSDDYIIFYSTMWHKKNIGGNVQWGEADFTIFNKKKGILVVEVKSGNISYKNNEWYQTRLDTGITHIMQNPLAQADRSKYRFIELLKANLPLGEKCRVEKFVWFPSIDNLSNIFDLPLEYSKNIILTSEALINPEKYIERIFDFYNMNCNFCLSELSINRVINILAPEFDLIASPVNKKEEIEYALIKLTDEQTKMLDYLEEQKKATIQGTAGTGKTLIAIEEAKRLAKLGDKVLYLCFNKFLYKSLLSEKISNLDINNLHSYLMQFNNDLDNNKKIVDVLKGITPKYFDYDDIIIDEGQDFPDDVIEFFDSIASNIKGKFFVFYDKNQLLYNDRYPAWIMNSECKLLLTKNCRNTFQIAVTSNNILNIKTIQNNNSIVGEMPVLKIYNNDYVSILEKCINDIRNDGFRPSEIVILTLENEQNSILTGVKQIGKYYISNKYNRSSNEILFTTSRKFKGLESSAVIVIDLNKKTLSNKIEKNNFYVATSRARQKLTILVAENEIESIASEINDIKLTNNVGKIALKFKVKPYSYIGSMQ